MAFESSVVMNKSEDKELVTVKFTLSSMDRQVEVRTVNRFLPLVNYKQSIETLSKVDLYGRQLVFQARNQEGNM
jgi:hypothetical protein